MYLLTTRAEYDYVKSKGYEPLVDDSVFQLEIGLRKQLQEELFGAPDIQRENEKFFRWVWANKPHYCEETMRPLRRYSAVYCSHILTRGAFPEMAHDPRNINILCFEKHNEWENGNRKAMRIYKKNMRTIEKLKKEYET